jgi:hypothetical protein
MMVYLQGRRAVDKTHEAGYAYDDAFNCVSS